MMDLPPELVDGVLGFCTGVEKLICSHAHPIFCVLSWSAILAGLKEDGEALYGLVDGKYDPWLLSLTEDERYDLVTNFDNELDQLYFRREEMEDTMRLATAECQCYHVTFTNDEYTIINSDRLRFSTTCYHFRLRDSPFYRHEATDMTVIGIKQHYRKVAKQYVPFVLGETLCVPYTTDYNGREIQSTPYISSYNDFVFGSCFNDSCKNSYRTFLTWEEPSDDPFELHCNTETLVYRCHECTEIFCADCCTKDDTKCILCDRLPQDLEDVRAWCDNCTPIPEHHDVCNECKRSRNRSKNVLQRTIEALVRKRQSMN